MPDHAVLWKTNYFYIETNYFYIETKRFVVLFHTDPRDQDQEP